MTRTPPRFRPYFHSTQYGRERYVLNLLKFRAECRCINECNCSLESDWPSSIHLTCIKVLLEKQTHGREKTISIEASNRGKDKWSRRYRQERQRKEYLRNAHTLQIQVLQYSTASSSSARMPPKSSFRSDSAVSGSGRISSSTSISPSGCGASSRLDS